MPLREPVVTLHPAALHVAGVPMTLPDQPLHRDSVVRITGRVQLRTGPSSIVPAVGASVGIRGIWWDYPSSVTAAPLPPDVCSVGPTLRLDHPAGATLHRCTLAAVGPVRSVREGTAAGAGELLLAPNALLNPAGGDLLRIGDPLTADDEVAVTDGFDTVADPAAPVRVRLRTPLGLMHRSGDPVQAVQPSAVAAIGNLSREGLAGDPVLFAPGLTALPTTSTVIVERGTPRAVFYRATQPPSTTNGVVFSHLVTLDATGRFAWPALGRIAQVRVTTNLPPHAPVQVDMALDYGGDTSLAIVLT